MRVYMLIDRSGSMQNLVEEAVSSINGYVKALDKKIEVFLAAFDTISYDVIRNTTVGKWKDINVDEVSPRGGTPLYDSAARVVLRALEDNSDRAYIVFMTDGEENMSRKYNQSEVKALLAQAENKNYEVVFLGANFDKVGFQATNIGLGGDKFINYAKGNMTSELNNLATATMAYASGGTRTSFSDADRTRAAATK